MIVSFSAIAFLLDLRAGAFTRSLNINNIQVGYSFFTNISAKVDIDSIFFFFFFVRCLLWNQYEVTPLTPK